MVTSGDFEDDDHREFFRVEQGSGGGNVTLSRAAFELSAFAIGASVRHDTPGFISDSYLGAETSLTAMELVVAGRWIRVEDGYEIADPEEKALAERLHRQQLEFDDWPKKPDECPEHMEGPNSRGRCCRCGTPLAPGDRIF
ncbi:hypothetical protein [Mycobacterium colombiense]|uniref:hypothetical protein n=1 Tax=Mycobacterium colombiense TaxID=339268 RepID=UPI0012DB47A4|nr:hypothetical protein [Mycobacterium colombiense]